MFFTYNTKIKQIGGIGDYICIPNVHGKFKSFEDCQPVPNPIISYVTQPQIRLWPEDYKGSQLKKEEFGRSLELTPAKLSEILGKKDSQKRIKRREILIKTLEKFEEHKDGLYYHKIARDNLIKWAVNPEKAPSMCVVMVIQEDWGVVAQSFTMKYGKCFAVLNMANGTIPGGAYTSGSAAQEENMFRRTDCHFSLNRGSKYTQMESNRINGVDGLVYLDTNKARVCIRGPEDITDEHTLGYTFLKHGEIFPFYELRAAAVNLHGGKEYSDKETRKRIAAQLDTLIAANIRYAVLSAFGCGAFENPADKVARVYYDALNKRRAYFDVVVFAIFYAGYGLENYKVFADVFKKW